MCCLQIVILRLSCDYPPSLLRLSSVYSTKFILLNLQLEKHPLCYRIENSKKHKAMSKSSTNIITHGHSGKVGDQFVLKHYGGITVIAKKPTFTKPWSPAQIANRKKFGKAARAAAAIGKKPEFQEKYSNKLKPRQNVLNLVVGEKLREIE